MRIVQTLCATGIVLLAVAMATAPCRAYYKGDTIYASTKVAYCKTIDDLRTYLTLNKSKRNAEVRLPAGCGTLDKDAKAVALNTSFHGYARVLLQSQADTSAKVYIQKTRWWTKDEENYFACMRLHEEDDFAEAYRYCKAPGSAH
jgi:hypothetical protein